MGVLVFRCPTTDRAIDPGIEDAVTRDDGQSTIFFVALHVRCPHCGEHHEIKIDRQSWNEAA